MTSYGWVRYVEVRRGGHGPIRSVKVWCTSVRHGHGEAVEVGCGVFRCGMLRYVEDTVRRLWHGPIGLRCVEVRSVLVRRSRSDMSGLGEDWFDRVSRGAVSQGGHGAGRRRTVSYGGSRRGGPVAEGRDMARSVKLWQGGQGVLCSGM